MARPLFETVVAQATRKQLKQLYHDNFNVNVAPGEFYTVDLFAPSGYIAKVESILLYTRSPAAYTGATSGKHQFNMNDSNNNITYLWAENNFDGALQFNNNYWEQFGTLRPTSQDAILTASHVTFDDEVGLKVSWWNDTDKVYDNRIKIAINYVEEMVSE